MQKCSVCHVRKYGIVPCHFVARIERWSVDKTASVTVSNVSVRHTTTEYIEYQMNMHLQATFFFLHNNFIHFGIICNIVHSTIFSIGPVRLSDNSYTHEWFSELLPLCATVCHSRLASMHCARCTCVLFAFHRWSIPFSQFKIDCHVRKR